ncbi:MAG TPA: succinate dehydrogenase/fumarate reductase cytochrome b subunit [Thermodesulfobacteriota bacterium]|nr:succinate dehydrogenase/fumarate reductase cytochrome b subunit [Thermodesulfobacteriota bacterium]
MPSQTLTLTRPTVRTAAYLDFLQMLTGVGLILFMWSHMILVASINLGEGTMNALAKFLEDTYMAQTGGPVIAAVFLVHFILAARKLPFRTSEQKAIWAHSQRLHHLDTWLWVVQAGTAMIILIMGSVHMWTVLTNLPITAAKSAARIQGGFWLVFFIILLPLVELHVGIGFYRIGVKWGVITRSNRPFYKRFENILTLIFLVIGTVTLYTFYTLALKLN